MIDGASAIATIQIALDRHYGLTRIRDVRRIRSNRNVLVAVHCEQGEFVVKAQPAPSLAIESEASVLSAAAALNLAVIGLCPSLAGRSHVADANLAMHVTRFAHGRAARNDSTDFFLLGQALAILHSGLDELPRLSLPSRQASSDALQCDVAAIAGATLHRSSRAELSRCGAILERGIETHSATLNDLAPCHGDPHYRNALVQANGRILWLDFEDAHFGARIVDLATLIWSGLTSASPMSRWRDALGGYASIDAKALDWVPALGTALALRHVWWLALHARHWEAFSPSTDAVDFFRDGVETLQGLCVVGQEAARADRDRVNSPHVERLSSQ